MTRPIPPGCGHVHLIATDQLDKTPVPGLPDGNGTLFGIALTPDGKGLYFVDDGTNTLNLFS